MLQIPARDGVDRVYLELTRHPEWLWPRNPEASMPEGLAEEAYAISEDVITTVWLLIVWQEEHVATDFAESVDIDAVVAEFRSHAPNWYEAKKRLAEEVDGLIDRAGLFRERIMNLIDNGVIVDNERVRSYCDEKLTSMRNAWSQYRFKLQAVIGVW